MSFDVGGFLKKAGTAVLGNFGLVGMGLAAAVNAIFPDDEVDKDTGADKVLEKFESLSPEQQEQIAKSLYNFQAVQAEWEGRVAIAKVKGKVAIDSEMEVTDRQNKVRPDIANRFAWLMTIIIFFTVALILYVSYVNKEYPSWDLIAAVTATPTLVILSFFKVRSRDKQLAAAHAQGAPVVSPMGMFEALGVRGNKGNILDKLTGTSSK